MDSDYNNSDGSGDSKITPSCANVTTSIGSCSNDH